MGRLVYVREVFFPPFLRWGFKLLTLVKDREAEPRFTGGPPRGEFGAGRGGFGGGFGGGGFGAGAAGRQLYVNNVGFLSHMAESQSPVMLTFCSFRSTLAGKI